MCHLIICFSIAVMHESAPATSTALASQLNSLVAKMDAYMEDVLKIPIKDLLQEHKDAWNDILHTGVSVCAKETHSELNHAMPAPM